MELPTVDKTHTSCRDCCLAVYDGKTQTGCLMGRTEIFSSQDCLIEAYDEEKEFFIVNTRVCNAHRNKESGWAKKYHPEKYVGIIKKEIELSLDLVIYIGEGYQEGLIEKTIESLRDHKINPTHVWFVNHQKEFPRQKLVNTIRNNWGDSMSAWSFTHIFQREMSKERSLDEILNKIRGRYYSIFNVGTKIPTTFVSDINDALNERLERFSLLRPNSEGNGLTIQTGFARHPLIGGNGRLVIDETEDCDDEEVCPIILNNIIEKAEYYAKLEDKPFLVGDIESVCIQMSHV